MRLLVLIITALAPLFTSAVQAQDLPGRVGRVAFIEGQVSVYHDPDSGWERARVNYPVTSENSLWTDRGSRAEMRVSGISVRLAETTQLDLARIDDNQIDAFITQGSINVRVRHFETGQRIDFSTPQARFRLSGDGRYRIDVDAESDEATLTVFAGSAVLRASRGNVQVRAGSALRVYGGSRSSYNFERASVTAFDRWSSARDNQWRETRSARYVSAYMTGYEDLDAYGEWREEPEFGALWFPTRVERDWAPYRYGRWEIVRPWGWTWVDDAPWGYAPFHYGRWVHVRDRWAWSPGQRESRPAWAPALVSWVGGTASASGGGSASPTVGWYPLSPWDRYQPWYDASPTYVNRVNVVVRSDPPRQDRQVWRQYAREQGATVVHREQFAESRPINQAALRLAPEAMRSLQAVTPTQALPPVNEVRTRRAQTQAQQAPAAAPPVATAPAAPRVTPQGATPPVPQQGATPPASPQGVPPPAAPRVQPQEGERGNRGERNDRGNRGNAPNFQRPQAAPEPAPANAQAAKGVPGPAPGPKPAVAAPEAPKGAAPPATRPDAQRQEQEKAAREAQQQQERAAREAQQQQEKAARDAQQQQEKAARERQQQEKGARDAQQQQEKAAREGQQQRERQQQEKAARDVQQQQEKAARDAQQQQEKAAREGQQQRERQQQEKAAREAQQQQEKAARDAQQQRDRQQQEKAARDAQQQQEKAARDAQQQQEKAAREAQQQRERQQQEKAARDAQQRAAPPAPPAAVPAVPAQPAVTPAPPAQPPAAPGKGRPRDKDKDEEKDKDKEDKEKGKAR